jgi:photosystem II stability/assembly factor-like uncharacterized protein
MGIEDRLRDGLRRSARQVADEGRPSEHLWGGIERGVLRARRRQTAARAATVAFALAVVAGATTWLTIAFTGSPREPVAGPSALSVGGVRVFGVPDGAAKIYGRVSNRGPGAMGAAITCTVLDPSAHVLGTATGSVPYIRAGASEAFGPLVGLYHGTPSSARCDARPIAALSPSPSSVARSIFQPRLAAFWDARHGILAGPSGNPSCDPSCAGVIELTTDGGHTWSVVYRGDLLYDVAVLDPSHAWALAGPCAMGTCDVHVLFSEDGGRTWAQRSTGDLKDLSFVSANEGWGVGNVFPTGSQRLESTSDGGRTWRARPVPCPRPAAVATAVSFVSPTQGWLLCTGQMGAGNADRAIMQTTDGGRTWSTVAQALLGGPTSGRLTTSGYPTGIFFLPDGHGWMWAERGVGIQVTTDGGRSWLTRGTVPNGADTSMSSTRILSDRTGLALLTNGNDQATQLIDTFDGGRTWRVIHSWPY